MRIERKKDNDKNTYFVLHFKGELEKKEYTDKLLKTIDKTIEKGSLEEYRYFVRVLRAAKFHEGYDRLGEVSAIITEQQIPTILVHLLVVCCLQN